ncbi:MAG: HU family DNA-binding protein [Pseudomonadota bacterium]
MKQLTKKQLVECLSDETSLTLTEAKRMLEGLVKLMHDELSNGHDFILPGIGKLSVRERAARTGRNPQTGESMMIAACKAVVFKSAKGLTDSVNG